MSLHNREKKMERERERENERLKHMMSEGTNHFKMN